MVIFKKMVTISVMLASVVCGSVFMCGIECTQGSSEACVAWSYTALMGIIALGTAVIWMVIGRK